MDTLDVRHCLKRKANELITPMDDVLLECPSKKKRHGGKAARKANARKNRMRKRREKAINQAKLSVTELERKLVLSQIAAETAVLLVAELAPGMAAYDFLNFNTGHPEHAAQVEAEKYHDERVAREEDGYSAIAPGTACILHDAFVLAHLTNDGYLTEEKLQELLYLLKEMSAHMRIQKRSSIAEHGATYGMGWARKYTAGKKRAFESYLIKAGKFRTEHGATIEEARPDLFKLTEEFALRFEEILGTIFPPAKVNREKHAQATKAPVFRETATTVMFDTFNYTTAAHCDRDNGRCKAFAVFLEEHVHGCDRQQCARRWRFFLPELKRFISVQHGTMVVWDSEVLLHGTAIHSLPDDGACNSNRWAVVSQVKKGQIGRAHV